ncbi:MAG TPA: hypothetical protein VHA37_09365, partial [Candidatus Saccharimonadales bacterium]|nr:hypothetical protein [Candidatus Saccharimonadales bacterium]
IRMERERAKTRFVSHIWGWTRMPRFYFDFRVGDRVYRDKFGEDYADATLALEGLRSVLVELVRFDGADSA